jgi:hypothetical protein
MSRSFIQRDIHLPKVRIYAILLLDSEVIIIIIRLLMSQCWSTGLCYGPYMWRMDHNAVCGPSVDCAAVQIHPRIRDNICRHTSDEPLHNHIFVVARHR